MKFTKTWKRFWTLNRHHAAGFTLVELIVVIAILAILAGIAIPAYSGYITKAKEAGDRVLLSAINTAFAAACMENGQDAMALTQDKVSINGYQKDSAADITVEPFNAEFQLYLGDSVKSNFEVIDVLIFEGGVFRAPNDTFSGIVGSLSAADKQAFLNSAFAGMGAEALLGKVDQLTGFGAALIGSEGSTFWELVRGEDGTGDTAFMQTLAAKMGYTNWEEDKMAFYAELGTMAENDPDKMNQILANGAVLSAADKTAGLDTSFLTGGNLKNDIKNNLNNADTAETGLAQASMAYAMYMAYANSDVGKAAGVTVPELNGVNDVAALTNMLGDMNSPGFIEYMNSDQGKADLAGYQSSMNMVNQSAQNGDALNSVLVNGFDDPELIGIMNSVINGK